MKVNNLFKALFAFSIIIILIGAFIKIEHYGNASAFLILGLVLNLSYVVVGILEVNHSETIERSEKNLWIFCFIFFSFFTAIAYLATGQRRIKKN